MINKSKEDCCGCTACASVCPKNAIIMKPDALGFLYPAINKDLCINCGLCDRVCSFHKDYDVKNNFLQPIAYAARHRNIHQIETSRSGAAFVAFSDWILEQKGVVYGVGHKNHFQVTHKRATTKDSRDEFKGSKYVQSDLVGIFPQIKKDLLNGIFVIFSGTPCQVAGLKSYVGEKLLDNLFLVDIVCHGVPGAQVWSDYLKYIEKKEGDTIININYRNKLKYGWSSHRETFYFSNKEVTPNNRFYNPLLFRLSCNKCPYCNLKRPGDVTIADFWGWKKSCPDFNIDDKGCNLVLLNSKKGQQMFESVKNNLNVILLNNDKILQPNLISPSSRHPKRLVFEKDYEIMGLEKTFRKYGLIGWQFQLNYYYGMVKHIIKSWLH